MSYALTIAEVRRGIFEERNLDCAGICSMMAKDTVLIVPEGDYQIPGNIADTIIRVKTAEEIFLNPLNLVKTIEEVFASRGKPDYVIFTHSSFGTESAAYTAGVFGLTVITDVSAYNNENGIFYKSYYSDKVFGEFKPTGDGPAVLTVRSGSFKQSGLDRTSSAKIEDMDGKAPAEGRVFIEYVEEEKSDIDITKADFLLSVGRGIGNKDEIPAYEDLAVCLKAVLSGSRPVIDKMWLPKPRQVGTSGKTVKPKVYLAMGISGAFQHIAGMKDSECIIAVNKDVEAPIFQYAHFGIVADIQKVRDKLKEMTKG